MKYYAHSRSNAPVEEWQKLEDHLENVACKAADFAGAFSSSQWGLLLGRLHDYGKARASFQGYLARVSALYLMYANGGENSAKLLGCADAGHVFDAGHRKVAQTFRHRFHSFCRFDILLTAMLRQSFTNFIFVTNTDGSGKAQTNFAHRVRISSSMCEIPGSADRAGLLKVGVMSFMSTKKASELTVNCAELKAA